MKQFKRIFVLVIFLVLGGIFNTGIITVNAKEADAIPEQLDYYILDSQNMLYYDYRFQSNSKILELHDVLFSQIGSRTFKPAIEGWILKDGLDIFDLGEDGFFEYSPLLFANNCVVVRTSMDEWFVHIFDGYVEEFEGQYERTLWCIDEEINMLVPSFDIDYNFKNFNRNLKQFSSAYNQNLVKYSKKLERSYYFENLHNNIGNNTKGSCSYVALGSLLSYYDIFYNDDIIPNTYTQNEVTRKFIEDEYVSNIDLTLCKESPGYTEDFHQFLIEIGDDLGYFQQDDDGNKTYGTNVEQIIEVLNNYLLLHTPIRNNNVSLKPITTYKEIRDFIDEDMPVFLNVYDWLIDYKINSSQNSINVKQGLGHSVIVYGYDQMKNGDIFYKSHLGYLNSSYNIFSEKMLLSQGNIVGFALDFKRNNNNCSSAYIYRDPITQEEIPYCPKCAETTFKDIHIHCRSNDYEVDTIVKKGYEITYEFETECKSYYDITITSHKALDLRLYKEEGTLLDDGNGLYHEENDYEGFIVKLLDKGKYYVKVSYLNNEESGTIHTTIKSRDKINAENIFGKSEVDVLEHFHNHSNIFQLSTNKSRIYRLQLVANNSQTINYPSNAITITDSLGNVVKKINGDETINATTLNPSNNLMFYAERSKIYYIKINCDIENITSLKLYVTPEEEFAHSVITNDSFVENHNMILGDYGKIITLNQNGTYHFDLHTSVGQNANAYISILKQNENGEYVSVANEQFNNENNQLNYTANITEPTNYMICYYNNQSSSTLVMDISKEVSENFTILTDISNQDCGSEVRVNGGSLNGTTITQGFTRNLYLGQDAPDRTSRLKYNWYSLDESVAKVSAYGTVTAIGVGTTTIQAVYKDDPSKIATIEIEVLPYSEEVEPTNLQYGMDVRIGGTISGTEVTSGKGNAIPVGVNPEVTIHRGYTRLICLGEDSPTTSVQDFNWEVMRQLPSDTGMVSVSSFGTVTATQEGFVTIKGTYKYNPNYIVYIRVQVI